MAESGKARAACAKRRILGGTVAAAVLAGAAVAALDGAWQAAGTASWRDAERRAVVAAALAPKAPLPAPAAAFAQASGRADGARPAAPRPEARRRTRPASSPTPAAAAPSPSLDARYARAAARECAPGIAGILCREAVKWRLCSGRWSERREPGRAVCYFARGAAAG